MEKEQPNLVPMLSCHRNVSAVYSSCYSRGSHIVFKLSYSLERSIKANLLPSNAGETISNPSEVFANSSGSTIQTVVYFLLERAGSSVVQKIQ